MNDFYFGTTSGKRGSDQVNFTYDEQKYTMPYKNEAQKGCSFYFTQQDVLPTPQLSNNSKIPLFSRKL
jgi:hypothetical protein